MNFLRHFDRKTGKNRHMTTRTESEELHDGMTGTTTKGHTTTTGKQEPQNNKQPDPPHKT